VGLDTGAVIAAIPAVVVIVPIPVVVVLSSVLRSGSVRFFASKWGNRNRSRLRINTDIDEPQPDRLEPVRCGS
jgi:hypothetical protein